MGKRRRSNLLIIKIMHSINEQLNIGIAPSPYHPTRYTRGLKTSQPQLGYEDWSLDFYNDTRSLGSYHNANGWGDQQDALDLGTDADSADRLYSNASSLRTWKRYHGDVRKSSMNGGESEWSNAEGVLALKTCNTGCKVSHPFNRGRRDACKAKCQDKFEAKHSEGGKFYAEEPSGGGDSLTSGGINSSSTSKPEGLSTGAMVGLVGGGIVILAIMGYVIFRK
jgi:hypothetical protein